MQPENVSPATNRVDNADGRSAAYLIRRTGRGLALAGVVLPLLLIGGLKFTQVEAEGLKPLIGVIEIATAVLLIASPWLPRAGVVGGALSALTFLVTVSVMFALPVWEERLGGFPALGPAGQFLIKDVALLGISLVVLGESLARLPRHSAGAS